MKLSEINVDEKLTVIKICLPQKFKKRLFELGIFEGASIRVSKKRKNAFIIIAVSETYYALRYKDAEKIEVEKYE